MDQTTKMRNVEKSKVYGVYIKSLLTQKVIISMNEVGKNIKQNLEKKITSKIEGRCIKEGFIKPNSVKIISYSSGLVNLSYIDFEVVFECMVCHPVEGMLIECDVRTVTKAGIHAVVNTDDGVVPVTVFVARDHNHNDAYFATIKENMKITVRVIGVRFELNDPFICVIAKLLQNRDDYRKGGELSILDEVEEFDENI
jgi:DNA-directed RNA polymerase subunit E'/Rpb7